MDGSEDGNFSDDAIGNEFLDDKCDLNIKSGRRDTCLVGDLALLAQGAFK